MTLHADIMQRAGDARSVGNYTAAVTLYETALRLAEGDVKRSETHCQIGVTRRLRGKFKEAEEDFEQALNALRGTNAKAAEARVLRDYGMLALDVAVLQGDIASFAVARERFQRSIRAFYSLGDYSQGAASRGFLGRAYLLEGDRVEAVNILSAADHVLRRADNISDERDNLVWLARASLKHRWRYVRRAIRITRGSRRLEEYLVLLVGGEWLYQRLAARSRR